MGEKNNIDMDTYFMWTIFPQGAIYTNIYIYIYIIYYQLFFQYMMVKKAHAADWPLGTASVSLKVLLCSWQTQQGVFWLVLVFDIGLIYPGPKV